jgi:DNA-binding cell septation regulator SpoVG
MEISLTEIQIIPTKPKNGLVAFVSFVLNDLFYVGDVAIYTKIETEGYRLVYPTKALFNGLRINCFKPIKKCAGEAIERAVLIEFEKLIDNVRTTEGSGRNESRVPAKSY